MFVTNFDNVACGSRLPKTNTSQRRCLWTVWLLQNSKKLNSHGDIKLSKSSNFPIEPHVKHVEYEDIDILSKWCQGSGVRVRVRVRVCT